MKENAIDFYNSNEYKCKLLATFRFTVDFLNQHNLRWYMGQGSCIGAIRHKGLIPWDDDIDLLMPREDYIQLHQLAEEFNGTGYRLSSWSINKTMIPFAKIIDNDSTIWEIKAHPYISGVFVDIFPMDLTDDNMQLIRKELRAYDNKLSLYQASMSYYSIKDIFKLGVSLKFHYFKEGCLSFLTHCFQDRYLEDLKRMDLKHNKKEGSHYILYSACFVYEYDKEIFKKEWFDDYILMQFEGIEVRVPKGYHEYLSHVYGNYMQLPPLEKRVTRHYHYYVNLKERKTLKEIKRIKNHNKQE